MRKKIRALLSLAGLREEEIRLYMLLLKLRKASMSELIELSKLNTMTAYRTIRRLQERGLVEAQPINNKQSMYEPLSLAALMKKIDAEQRKLRRLQLALQDLDHLLPFVDVEHEAEAGEDLIEICEGLDAFRAEYLCMPDVCKEEYLHIGNMENYWKVAGMTYDSPDELSFRAKRFRKGIYCRIVNVHTDQSEEFVKRDSLEMRSSKIRSDLPVKDNYIAIAESRVTHFLCDTDNPRAIVIHQPEVVDMYHMQFKDLWQSSS